MKWRLGFVDEHHHQHQQQQHVLPQGQRQLCLVHDEVKPKIVGNLANILTTRQLKNWIDSIQLNPKHSSLRSSKIFSCLTPTKITLSKTNWIWMEMFFCSVLGKGATGAVFQGVNKHNGETVAVRIIFQLNYSRFKIIKEIIHIIEILNKHNGETVAMRNIFQLSVV